MPDSELRPTRPIEDLVEEGSAVIKEFFHENAPKNLPNREKKQHFPT
jgi:hypothetical protein